MPTYDIFFRCRDCGAEHPLLLTIFLVDGPERSQSIAEWLHGRASLPPQVSALRHHAALCLKTGRKFTLDEDADVFLVPRWARPSKLE